MEEERLPIEQPGDGNWFLPYDFEIYSDNAEMVARAAHWRDMAEAWWAAFTAKDATSFKVTTAYVGWKRCEGIEHIEAQRIIKYILDRKVDRNFALTQEEILPSSAASKLSFRAWEWFISDLTQWWDTTGHKMVRKCPECGRWFRATDPRKMYDRIQCAAKAGKRRRRAEKKQKGHEQVLTS